jgi:hypothetical protein
VVVEAKLCDCLIENTMFKLFNLKSVQSINNDLGETGEQEKRIEKDRRPRYH